MITLVKIKSNRKVFKEYKKLLTKLSKTNNMYSRTTREEARRWKKFFISAMENEKIARKETVIKTEEIADTRLTSAMR